MTSQSPFSLQPRLAPNDLLREYRIVQLVGMGGMGAVYEAEHVVMKSRVAIKEILFHPQRVEANEYERLKDAFLKEARLLTQLDPRQLPPSGAIVPRAYNIFQEGDYWYLVMEYIPGETIEALWEKNGYRPLPVEKVEAWFIQLLTTLQYLHEQTPPLIHRDIKPANLKVHHDGRLVLLDFGIAKGGGGNNTTGLSASIQFYSPHYSPPEQLFGKNTDSRADLFAAAATMYTLLSGEPPPKAETRTYARIEGVPDPIVPLNERNPNVPQPLAELIQSALALNPDNRPQSAAEMRDMMVRRVSPFATIAKPKAGAKGSAPEVAVAGVTPSPELNRQWGTPSAMFTETPKVTARPTMPLAYIAAGIVALLLVFLVGSQLMSGVGNNPPAVTGGTGGDGAEGLSVVASATAALDEGNAVENAPATAAATTAASPTEAEAEASATVVVNSEVATAVPTSTRIATSTILPTTTETPIAGTTVDPNSIGRETIQLLAPTQDSTFMPGNVVTFAWEGQPLGVDEAYFVCIWKQSTPDIMEEGITVTDTSVDVVDFDPDVYRWTVEVTKGGVRVEGTVSAVQTFIVD